MRSAKRVWAHTQTAQRHQLLCEGQQILAFATFQLQLDLAQRFAEITCRDLALIKRHFNFTVACGDQPDLALEMSGKQGLQARLQRRDISALRPQGTDVAALQPRLQPLFTTHFQREIWLITTGNSEIEVAFDQGEVTAGDLSEPLCEIELELKRGERQDLLAFAQQLVALGGLRMGPDPFR